MKNNVQLMDVTLRDGSYAVNFQFSCQDVRIIGKALEESGIELIEIGHGMGLGASSPANGLALNSDEEYLEAAAQTFSKAKFGMFCIPGIASLEDIDLAASYGMGFIRIGTNVDEVTKSEKYIERAKKHGMQVFSNYMKSYTVSPQIFADNVGLSVKYGADAVYIVDSAGGMLQEDIAKYYHAVREKYDIGMGFHGHDNLGLAVSNSLYAVDLGIEYVDASLQGLGRSAGNASLELLIACLMKKYDMHNYDCKKLLMAGRQLIYPLIHERGINPLDVYSGLAEFHSSYMRYIHKYAGKYSVNPLELIYQYCQIDKVNMQEDVLQEIAKKLPKEDIVLSEFAFNDYIGNEQK